MKPLVSDPASDRGGGSSLDEETFLGQVPERLRDSIAEFLETCTAAGADVLWRKYGPSITVMREHQRQVAYFEAKRFGVVLQSSGAFPKEPFNAARTALGDLDAGAETKDAWYRSIPLGDIPESKLAEAFRITRELVDALVPTVAFTPLAAVIEATFTRKDHNIWASHVPPLADLQSKQLRGHLIHVPSNRQAAIDLIPLANNQPGWRPRFRPATAKDELWPADLTGDTFRLVVEATS